MCSTWRCCAAAALVVATRVTCGTCRAPGRALARAATAAARGANSAAGRGRAGACGFFSTIGFAVMCGVRVTTFLAGAVVFFLAGVVVLRLLAVLLRVAVCFFILLASFPFAHSSLATARFGSIFSRIAS